MESQAQIMSCPEHNIPQLVSLMVRKNKGSEQALMGSRGALPRRVLSMGATRVLGTFSPITTSRVPWLP